jgi:hypothetical protein
LSWESPSPPARCQRGQGPEAKGLRRPRRLPTQRRHTTPPPGGLSPYLQQPGPRRTRRVPFSSGEVSSRAFPVFSSQHHHPSSSRHPRLATGQDHHRLGDAPRRCTTRERQLPYRARNEIGSSSKTGSADSPYHSRILASSSISTSGDGRSSYRPDGRRQRRRLGQMRCRSFQMKL